MNAAKISNVPPLCSQIMVSLTGSGQQHCHTSKRFFMFIVNMNRSRFNAKDMESTWRPWRKEAASGMVSPQHWLECRHQHTACHGR